MLLQIVNSQVQSIKNGISWKDTDGNRIQAHGASIIKHNGLYYMIGEDRSNQFIFKGVNLYSSSDLMNWEFRNNIIDENTNSHLKDRLRITERPCIIYNQATNKFVVWIKYQNAQYTNNKVGIFTSSTIDGKYTYIKEFFPDGYDSNDGNLFQDTDGKAYYISTNKANGSLNLYTLSSDYLDVVDSTILFPGENKEAPVIFKKDNLYYMLSSTKTGWDPNQMRFSTSTSLKSGWSAWQLVGNKITFDSQPTDVIKLTGTNGTNFYYVGDRWKDLGLRESKIVMFPLNVNNGSLSMNYVKEFKIDLSTSDWIEYDDNVYVPQENWSLVSVSSQELTGSYMAVNAFDGDDNTMWHTKWSGGADAQPHEIVINLGANYDVSGFSYVPRKDSSLNGIVRDFQLFFSTDGINWGAPTASGWLGYNTDVFFETTQAHYMKFVSYSDFNGTNYTSAAELKLMMNNEFESGGINSYVNVDSQGWYTGTNINVNIGSRVEFGPQAWDFNGGQTQFYGFFSWYGPSNYHSTERAPIIDNIQANQLGEYTVYYLDDRFSMQKKTLNIRTNSLSTDDDKINSNANYLYPNPVRGGILNIGNSAIDTSYSVYDISGKLLNKNRGNTIDVSLLRPGYYIAVINGKGYKFIKN
ncbi:hypothetical protein GCM10023163_20470 [Aestuariibaculum suncheonense]